MWLSTTRLALKEGVTSQTIRRWIKQGKYETRVTVGGHFRVKYNQETRTICYARVSSRKQESSIDKQKEILQERYPDGEFLFDIGSGFNFKRRNFVRILEWCLRGDSVKVVATTPDRLSRSGLAFIIKTIQFHGGDVEFLEDDNVTESFDISTLIAFLTSFCNPQSGKRNSKRYTQDKSLSKK